MFFEASEGINEVTDTITQYVRFCENVCIPSKTITVYPNNKALVDKELKELLQNKQRAIREKDRDELKKIKAKLKKDIKKKKAAYKEKIEKDLGGKAISMARASYLHWLQTA